MVLIDIMFIDKVAMLIGVATPLGLIIAKNPMTNMMKNKPGDTIFRGRLICTRFSTHAARDTHARIVARSTSRSKQQARRIYATQSYYS